MLGTRGHRHVLLAPMQRRKEEREIQGRPFPFGQVGNTRTEQQLKEQRALAANFDGATSQQFDAQAWSLPTHAALTPLTRIAYSKTHLLPIARNPISTKADQECLPPNWSRARTAKHESCNRWSDPQLHRATARSCMPRHQSIPPHKHPSGSRRGCSEQGSKRLPHECRFPPSPISRNAHENHQTSIHEEASPTNATPCNTFVIALQSNGPHRTSPHISISPPPISPPHPPRLGRRRWWPPCTGNGERQPPPTDETRHCAHTPANA